MKKYQMSLFFFLAFATLIIVASCVDCSSETIPTGQIFLYGEVHGVPRIMDRQIEIWHDYYHNHNMRHMFIEFPYFTAEFLNMWMLSDNDDILYKLFNEWTGAAGDSSYLLEFFKTIKREFPETIFHGIDVGHRYHTTGRRFLQYLRDNNKQGSEQYLLTLEAVEQGENWRRYRDIEFRETKMTKNFISTFDRLAGQNIMGIFGVAHTAFGYLGWLDLPNVPTMAERLRERYGDFLHTTDLSWLALLIDPIRVDIISINSIDYNASYFGTDFTTFRNIVSRSFWRLENAYDDFRDKLATGDWLPFDNYPMKIELNQVFIVDFKFTDSSTERLFYRSDGDYWQGTPITREFLLD